MKQYELAEPVRAEIPFMGGRHLFEHAAGTVKPRSEQDEAALEYLAATQPDVCKAVKAETRRKAPTKTKG